MIATDLQHPLLSLLTPEDVQTLQPCWLDSRRLRIGICNVDKMLDRDLRKRDDFRLFPELESEVQQNDDGDIDVGRDECLGVPLSVNEDDITTEEQQN